MDRDYYYRSEAAAHQTAIEKELATRHLLREEHFLQPQARKEARKIRGAAPVSIILHILRHLRLAR